MNSSRSIKNSPIDSIRLCRVIPAAFADEINEIHSDIWARDFEFCRGQFYRVDSSSGGGKSSLCSFIYGLRDDYQGSILIGDIDIKTLSQLQLSQIRSLKIAYLPQDLALFPELTVEENIEIKNSLTGYKTRDQIIEMARRLGISHLLNRRVSTLSIGQQQRVAIIRTLCQPFDFILLDEPVSHLDDDNNLLVSKLITDEATAQGAAVIATSVGNHLSINNPKIVKL